MTNGVTVSTGNYHTTTGKIFISLLLLLNNNIADFNRYMKLNFLPVSVHFHGSLLSFKSRFAVLSTWIVSELGYLFGFKL